MRGHKRILPILRYYPEKRHPRALCVTGVGLLSFRYSQSTKGVLNFLTVLHIKTYALFLLGWLMMIPAVRGYAARLEGFEPDYAGRTIQFFTRTDPVTKNELSAFTLTIGPQGRILVETGVKDTLFCYADFDTYRGWILIVPETTTKIALPPLKPRTFEERKNPYFQPVELWLWAESSVSGNLTAAISQSERRFYQLNDVYFNQLFVQQQKQYIDTLRHRLKQEYSGIKHPLPGQHHQLLLASLEADLTRSGREKLLAPFTTLSATTRNSPAFADLIDRIFSNTLSIESKSSRGSQIRVMVERRNISALREWSEQYAGTRGDLTDILLLKLLHDAFYSGDFSKNTILEMVQLPYFQRHANLSIRSMAGNLLNKLQFLHTGTKAPEICLPTFSGNTVCSSSSGKPFSYLLFIDLDIPVGGEQLKYLAEIYPGLSHQLDLFIVLLPGERTNIRSFVEEHKIPGTIVVDQKEQDVGKQFKIRSYPSALLLDRQHRVVIPAARTPLDGFVQQFRSIAR